MIAARGMPVNWSSGDEKNYILHDLFCIFILIFITIIIVNSSIISISISFFALLNCLYLTPQV